MSEIIRTTENISDIALAYFDEVDETLKEINENNLYFSLSPFSTQHKRLYLIGDLIYKDVVRVYAYIGNGDFEVKLSLLDSFTSVADFSDATDNVYCTLDNTHLNSIPLDILVISNNISYSTVTLEIEIIVGEEAPR